MVKMHFRFLSFEFFLVFCASYIKLILFFNLLLDHDIPIHSAIFYWHFCILFWLKFCAYIVYWFRNNATASLITFIITSCQFSIHWNKQFSFHSNKCTQFTAGSLVSFFFRCLKVTTVHFVYVYWCVCVHDFMFLVKVRLRSLLLTLFLAQTISSFIFHFFFVLNIS